MSGTVFPRAVGSGGSGGYDGPQTGTPDRGPGRAGDPERMSEIGMSPQPGALERSFPRRFDALDEVFRFTAQALSALGAPDSLGFSANLVVEEIFTNMVKFHPEGAGEITLRVDRQNGRLLLCLVDHDVDDFDITKVPEIDVNRPLAERKPGGLGIHLVRRIAETFSYRYEDRARFISVTLPICE